VIGQVRLGNDVTRRVRADQVVPGTLAGLCEGKADCGRLGLIVTQATANDMPTAQGACVGSTSDPPPRVQPISPITYEAGMIGVQTPGDEGATS
jgi:hypothetical protein